MMILLFPGVSTLKANGVILKKAKGATIRDSQEKNIQELINKKKFLSIFAPNQMLSESEVAQLWPTLRDPMNCNLPGSFVHGIFQARILEWVAVAFSLTKCLGVCNF